MMMDRFKLEEQIMNSWQVVEDLQLLARQGLEGKLTHQDITNAALGLAVIYSLRFQELFQVFEDMVHNNGFNRGE
jgi:hypothetical protein